MPAARSSANHATYYYPIYSDWRKSVVSNPNIPIPVTLYSGSNSSQVPNIVATSTSSTDGVTGNIGRRLSDYTILTLALTGEKIRYNTTVPSPYYFQGNHRTS